MSTQSFGVDLHGLVRISAPAAPPDVAAALARRFGVFSTDAAPGAARPDIVLEHLDVPPPYTPEQNRFNILYGFGVTELDGRPAVVFTHRGRPDVVLTVSDAIHLRYAHRPRIAHRLYGLLLYSIELVLSRKGGMLFHGAAARRDDTTLIITGHRGTKKTMLLLSLLRDGWKFLSDDKMILHDNSVKLFQPVIRLRGHHVTSLPWLAELVRGRRSFLRQARIGNACSTLAQRLVYKHLLPAVEQRLNPALELDAGEVFPGTEPVSCARPTHVALLTLGPALRAERVQFDDCADDIVTTQELLFAGSGNLEKFLRLYHVCGKRDLEAVVRRNIRECATLRVAAPLSCTVDTMKEALLSCLP